MPGCATLTEIVTAKEFGAEIIKIFPGSVLGPGFVSSILPVVPDLNLMITGGVEPTEENLSAWFKAGAMAVGMGSQLFTKEILEKKDWAQLKMKVSQALSIAAKQN
jgi:2-dehydro-3-deoxyphosphogluconate aldolase/(4S)-4-hydroxy-2-oxoglutarate aldolase